MLSHSRTTHPDVVAFVASSNTKVGFYDIEARCSVGEIEVVPPAQMGGEGMFSLFRIDAETIAVGEWRSSGRIFFVDIETGVSIRVLHAADGCLWRMCFVPRCSVSSDRKLVAGNQRGMLEVFDASGLGSDDSAWDVVCAKKLGYSTIYSICSIPEMNGFATAGTADSLKIYRLARMDAPTEHGLSETTFDVLHCEKMNVLIGSYHRFLAVYDLRDFRRPAQKFTHSFGYSRVAFADESIHAALVGLGDGRVLHYDFRMAEKVSAFTPHPSGPIYSILPALGHSSLSQSQVRPTFVSNSQAGTIAQWRIDGKQMREIIGGQERLLQMILMGEAPGGFVGRAKSDESDRESLLERVEYLCWLLRESETLQFMSCRSVMVELFLPRWL